MTTLVIPDIHQRLKRVELALERETYNQVVFLGDWFDTFAKPPYVSSFGQTCHYLKYLTTQHPKKSDFVFLLGNHDLPYIYHNRLESKQSLGIFDSHGFIYDPTYFCPGFNERKSQEFRKVFFDCGLKDDFFLSIFRLAHKTQGFLLSHAGIHPNHLQKGESIQDHISITLPKVWKEFRHPTHPQNHILSAIGASRGGEDTRGGILWLDAHEEFQASEEIGRQIFGHTVSKTPRVFSPSTNYESWCLDTARHYATITNSELEIKRYEDLN